MNETSEFRTTDEKVQHIELYLVRQVDAIQRLLFVTIGIAVVAVLLAILGLAGQQRVISIAESRVAPEPADAAGLAQSSAASPAKAATGAAETGASETDAAETTGGETEPVASASPRKAGEPEPAPRAGAEALAGSAEPATGEPLAATILPEPPASGSASDPVRDAPASRVKRPADAAPGVPATPQATTATPSTKTAEREVGRLEVERSAIAAEIVGLSPQGTAKRFPRSQPALYCWSRIVTPEFDEIPLGGRAVVHRWRHEGEAVHERRITIGSSSYRVYSALRDPGKRPGRWSVEILDASGRLLATEEFVID